MQNPELRQRSPLSGKPSAHATPNHSMLVRILFGDQLPRPPCRCPPPTITKGVKPFSFYEKSRFHTGCMQSVRFPYPISSNSSGTSCSIRFVSDTLFRIMDGDPHPYCRTRVRQNPPKAALPLRGTIITWNLTHVRVSVQQSSSKKVTHYL